MLLRMNPKKNHSLGQYLRQFWDYPVFSRRFSRKNSRLLSWLFVSVFKIFFFDTPEVTKIVVVPQKFYIILRRQANCTRWPKELSQKGFPRNIQNRRRPKGPPFPFSSALPDFFSGKNFPKGSPFQFFRRYTTEWMLKNPEGSPFQFFGIVRLF